MCDRCADLEEQVAFLRGELGLTMQATELANLRASLGLTETESRILSVLRHAKGVVRSSLLEQVLSGENPDRYYEDLDGLVRVFISKIRGKLGHGTIENAWGLGYRLTPIAQERLATL